METARKLMAIGLHTVGCVFVAVAVRLARWEPAGPDLPDPTEHPDLIDMDTHMERVARFYRDEEET